MIAGDWSTAAAAAVVFAATNVDDILLLAAFFGDRRVPRGAIVAGQFLGIAVLTAASALAACAAIAVPDGWIALLGLVPLTMGLVQLWRWWRGQADGDDAAAPGTTRRGLIAHTLGVAGVTLANGGDNLGAYVPMFARDVSMVPLIAATFAVLTGVLVAAGYLLVANVAGRAVTSRVGQLLLPLVLIALGVWILADARLLFA